MLASEPLKADFKTPGNTVINWNSSHDAPWCALGSLSADEKLPSGKGWAGHGAHSSLMGAGVHPEHLSHAVSPRPLPPSLARSLQEGTCPGFYHEPHGSNPPMGQNHHMGQKPWQCPSFHELQRGLKNFLFRYHRYRTCPQMGVRCLGARYPVSFLHMCCGQKMQRS